MNYTAILEALNQASLFDLYRLNAAIREQLDDPRRTAAVKRALRPGQAVRWFDDQQNRLVAARLEQMNRTRAVVVNVDDRRQWTIPFYLIDLAGVDTDIAPRAERGLDRTSVKVGDRVAFHDRQGQERFGEVVKRNQKTATVVVHQQLGGKTVRSQWRVAYALLSPVIDGERGSAHDALPGSWTQVDASESQDAQTPGQGFDGGASGAY